MDLTDLIGPVEHKDPKQPSFSQKAILWGRDDVLAHSIESILKGQETWELVRIFPEQGTDYLIEQVIKLKPELVVLYTGDCAVDKSLMGQLIQDQPEQKVVTISLENNLMQVYEKHNHVLQEASDLLSIIESRHFSCQSLEGR